MKPVKKIEIVIDSIETNKILELLERVEICKYTVIKDVTGKGGHGIRDGQDLTSIFNNSYIMIACSEEQLSKIIEVIRPVLKQFGGVCLVSDAQWIMH